MSDSIHSIPAVVDVLVVYQSSLFACGVVEFIGKTPEIRIVGMESDAAKALEVARDRHPSVVIVEESVGPAACPLLNLPDGSRCPLFTLLEQASVQRVMGLRIDDIMATVYETRRIPIRDASSLVAAIVGSNGEKKHWSKAMMKEVM